MTIKLNHYKVRADAATGEWLSDPEFVGLVDTAEWSAKTDTDTEHFDTWENGDEGTCAIEVSWHAEV